MTITSFSFLIFVIIGMIIYYAVPKKCQWTVLLLLSAVFYYFAASFYTIIWLVLSTLTAYGSTMYIEKCRSRGKAASTSQTVVVSIAIITNISIWFVFKAVGIWSVILGKLNAMMNNSFLDSMLSAKLVAALGMGYYTLQIIGYILDYYWGNVKIQKNPLKLFLFAAYFPQLITGPISRYSQLESLYQEHTFKYDNLAHGAQRILWGFFKKLVIAERVGILVSSITGDTDKFTGFYIWVAILMYPIQMYADFSGCMDIVIGASEIFGITLPENFNNPFFSRTSQEFWQRWHITLGAWAKDYVLYPLLKTKAMIKLGKFTKAKFGKKAGKFIASSVGMLALWLIMGIWHGGMRYIVGVSLWYWIILMLEELLTPVSAKLNKKLGVNEASFSRHLFQSVRTYLIYAIGATFFCVGVSKGAEMIVTFIKTPFDAALRNPWIFFDSSILETGVSFGDINLIILGTAAMLIVGVLREKYGYARNWVDEQGLVFRWSLWSVLFVIVLVFGMYGPLYDSSAFIYQNF